MLRYLIMNGILIVLHNQDHILWVGTMIIYAFKGLMELVFVFILIVILFRNLNFQNELV